MRQTRRRQGSGCVAYLFSPYLGMAPSTKRISILKAHFVLKPLVPILGLNLQ